jgi:site-specific DNA-methyltransferase (cytosine-N4-specific)
VPGTLSLFDAPQKTPSVASLPEDDWTFHRAETRDLTHCYHDYPARMIPQIARKLLERFGAEAKTLFDPYCGTGTSLVEGRVYGLSVQGTDLNPLARCIAAAKTATVSLESLDAALQNFEQYVSGTGQRPITASPVVSGIDRLEFWFKPAVIEKLTHLRNFVTALENEPVRLFFQVAFSETVRECSNTRNHEFKLYRMEARQLEPFAPNVYETMRTKLSRNRIGLVGFLRQLKSLPQMPPSARLYDFNTVDGIPAAALAPQSVDIVITSPPYGDSATTVAYGQYSRLSAAWLGFAEPEKVDRRLMGGKTAEKIPVFASPMLNDALGQIAEIEMKRAREVAAFYRDLEASITHIAPLVRTGGYVCYVVGNRRVKGVTLPTDDAVRRAFEQYGFQWQDTFVRTIPNKRMPLKNSPSNVPGVQDATMTNEYIVVLKQTA